MPDLSPLAIRALRWAQLSAQRPAQATWPLFVARRPDPPVFAGSGVLLRLQGRPFLLTAAHVSDVAPATGLLVGTSSGIRPMYGRRYVTKVPASAQREDDRLDIAVLCLDERSALSFEGSSFLEQGELAMAPSEEPPPSVLLVGYPTSIQRTSPRRPPEGASVYTLLASPAPSDYYADLHYSKDTHLLIPFDRHSSWRITGKSTSPDLHGVSGCGLWFLDEQPQPARPTARLAGIVTGWNPARPKCIIASRLIVPLTAILKDLGIR